tara:strand:- start:194 stop:463 length:270 start_codon:yes stop_codon:yes gene_type:complete
MYVIDDIWIYIKEYLFHNIKYSKHLGDDKYIKEYNLILKKIPRYNDYKVCPKVIYNKNKNIIKSLYHVNMPNKKEYITLLEYTLLTNNV